MSTYRHVAVLFVSSFVVGCSGGGDDGVAWVGEGPHLVVHGIIDGEAVDIDLQGADAIAAGVSCERE